MMRVALALALPLALFGCGTSTLNTPCTLVKSCDGGVNGVCPITNGEINSQTTSLKDFITIGSVECEDWICVRDSAFPKNNDLTAPAQGYCSAQCSLGESCPSQDSSLDQNPATQMTCRALLLDAATLAKLKGNPALGGVESPYFCARGAVPDGGQ